MNIACPFAVDSVGRTAQASDDDHTRQMIEQVLLTSTGARVNQPQFGTEIRQLLFEGATSELSTALLAMTQSALRRWMGDTVSIETVELRRDPDAVSVQVRYSDKLTSQRRQFTIPV